MAAINFSTLDWAVASAALAGETESGDKHCVIARTNETLIGVVDGIGHGDEAACAAEIALSVLSGSSNGHLISLMQLCHERLRGTRGVVMSLASIDRVQNLLTWLGVGNVQGVLLRGLPSGSVSRENLLLRGGVVGAQLPSLQASVLPVGPDSTIVLATDGIHHQFADNLYAAESAQKLADRIMTKYRRGNDDALVLVVRVSGSAA